MYAVDRGVSKVYDIIILDYHICMTTLSVPLTADLEEFIKRQVKSGRSPNKAAVVRSALKLLSEEEAVQAVLRAQQEPTLRGDLRELAKKLRTK